MLPVNKGFYIWPFPNEIWSASIRSDKKVTVFSIIWKSKLFFFLKKNREETNAPTKGKASEHIHSTLNKSKHVGKIVSTVAVFEYFWTPDVDY